MGIMVFTRITRKNMFLNVSISYAQLKYKGFRKRTEEHCSILLRVFQVSLFIFYHWEIMDKDIDSSILLLYY